MMKKKLACILLIDDDDFCNFIHDRVIKKFECTESVEIVKNGLEAIQFLKSKKNIPELILLDINMPKMDGWEFLDEYKNLNEDEKSKIIIVMLTTSLNPNDRTKAASYQYVNDYDNKYLNEESLEKILMKHFPDHF